MSTITIKNLTFCHSGSYDNIFENVNLQLDTDWRLGLTGRNGKGKTTLLKLLCGQYQYSGSIQASVKFEYFPFEIDKNLTVMDALMQINPDHELWQVQRDLNLLEFCDIDFYRPLRTYSNGEQTKILLAALFSKENAFLLIDEPTNHLDLAGRRTLADYLLTKSSYVIVSHDKRFVDGCVDHILSINNSNIEVQKGNLSSYLRNKKMQDEAEAGENARLKSEIKRLKEASRQTASWADSNERTKFGGKQDSGLRPDRGYIGAKSAKLMKRASVIKSRVSDSIEEKSRLLQNIDRKESLHIRSEEFFGYRLLTVKDLVISYAGTSVNAPLSFEVCGAERISLSGKNGCGKTSIIKAILGQLDNYTGTISRNQQLKISYVPQDTSFLCGSLHDFCSEHGLDKPDLLSMLYKFGLERTQFDKPLEDYSEGQKKKLLLAKSLCEYANLYIWDEPLNYLDILSREQVKESLLSGNIPMIFVEHDAEFVDDIATKEVHIIKKS